MRVDLVVDGQPHRVMHDFTSATNFLAYVGHLKDRRVAIDVAQHEMIVVARARLGRGPVPRSSVEMRGAVLREGASRR